MGLGSIWDHTGNYLTKRSRGFRARSTGCSCCSTELTTEAEVRKEAMDSLYWVMKAANYFGWDIKKMISQSKQRRKC